MNEVMIDPNLCTSQRFEILCDYLGADTPESINSTLGHLMQWWLRWAGDVEIDSGLFFGVSPKRMGLWSAHPSPEKFGNGLVGAGFVVPLEKVYPAELLSGRGGFCVRGSLDRTWRGVHFWRTSKIETCFWLLDPVARATAVVDVGADPAKAPPGWVDVSLSKSAGPRAKVGHRPDLVGGSVGNSGGSVEVPIVAASAPVPAPTVTVLNGEEKKQKISSVNISRKQYTGAPKTEHLRTAMREVMYEDPLRALLLCDTARDWQVLCSAAVRNNAEAVRSLLATTTEPNTWIGIRVPRLQPYLKPHVQKLAKPNGQTSPTGEDASGSPSFARNSGGGYGGRGGSVKMEAA